MRDSKGTRMSSALNRMMKKIEATGSLASRQMDVPEQPLLLPQQLSRRCNPCRRLLPMERAVLEKFRGRQECDTEVSGEHCE
ncbi:hypothetical protein TNCV_1916041 [Trichonephila clavipes]|uniref:Uncharacterized protein n=1 Tax=Trichonephila clavipes TaxID=2585209 RepID=A0A8X6W0H4_TRICX|nr:hypothetical protein TNCV_1916041 [Trichonephila clavipes]